MFEDQYGRSELDAFVNFCNPDNSHIVDVLPESDICELLSRSIVKETANNEAAADDEARVIENDNHVTLSEGNLYKGKTAEASCMHAA